MNNIVDYVNAFADTSFAEHGFSEVDGLILSELSYVDWNGIVPGTDSNGSITLGDAIDLYFAQGRSSDKDELLHAIRESDRFADMDVSNFAATSVTSSQAMESGGKVQQFSAVTFSYDRGDGANENFLAYRGTDNTMEGWREDFNMAYDRNTDGQISSANYADTVAQKLDGDIRMGGHSKGGNHSNYAFLHCDDATADRVVGLYAYDAPGMLTRDVISNPRYGEMSELLDGHAYAPYDSVIGQVLTQNEYSYVNAGGDKGMFYDHDGFKWEVDVNTGTFVHRDQSEVSLAANSAIDALVAGLPDSTRKKVVNLFFDYAELNGCKNFDEVLDMIGSADSLKGLAGYMLNNGISAADVAFIIGGLVQAIAAATGTVLIYEVEEMIKNLYNEIKNKVEEYFDELGEKFDNAVDDVKEWFGGLFGADREEQTGFGSAAAQGTAVGAAVGAAAGSAAAAGLSSGFSGRLMANAEDILYTADSFDRAGSDVSHLTSEMVSAVAELREIWRGTAADKYVAKFGSINKDMKKMSRMISEHSNDLRAMAENYKKSESESAQMAESLNSELIF